MNITEGTKVIFQENADITLQGTITRIWTKPVSDPYVSIRSDDGRFRMFVRCSSRVKAV